LGRRTCSLSSVGRREVVEVAVPGLEGGVAQDVPSGPAHHGEPEELLELVGRYRDWKAELRRMFLQVLLTMASRKSFLSSSGGRRRRISSYWSRPRISGSRTRMKASRSLIRVLVINDNHYGLTFLFEL
jgi:hypothetical protein